MEKSSSPLWRYLLLACLLALSGCSGIKLVSDYDEKIDQGVTDLQKKVEKILGKIDGSLDNPAKVYAAADYADIKADLNVLITRAGSLEKNEITVKQLYTIGYALLADPPQAPAELKLSDPDSTISVEARNQKSASFSAASMRLLRKDLNISFQAILSLELAKKRGKS